jgi:hypothetical protein
MNTTFYIHIGVPKTGTTSIQHTMFKNRDELLTRGINYLSIHQNHGSFLVSLLRDNPHETRPNIRRYVDTPEKAAAYNAQNRQRLTEIFSSNQSPKIAISGEALSGLPADSVRGLKQMCDPYATAYRIIVYVRDPYEYANSAFLQHLKDGATLSRPRPIPLTYYQRKIEKYIDVFGRKNVDIRIFDSRRFVGGSLISDFLTALGESPTLENSMEIARANEALSHEAALILSEANIAIPMYVDGRANRARAFGFHSRLAGIKGEKFSISPHVYLKRRGKILADIEWLHGCIGESVFGDPTLRAASSPCWSDETIESIKITVCGIASTIRQLRAARQPSIWRSIFQRPRETPWRLREKRDFSQALNPNLDDIAIPAGLEWLREAIGQPANPEARSAVVPLFDQATIRSLACFIHDLTLTIERLKAEQASPSRRRKSRVGMRNQ